MLPPNHSFNLICLKAICSLSLTPTMIYTRLDQVWSSGLIEICVWKCERMTTGDDDGPSLCSKLKL